MSTSGSRGRRIAVALVGVPVSAYADNCSSLDDCWGYIAAAALVTVFLGVGVFALIELAAVSEMVAAASAEALAEGALEAVGEMAAEGATEAATEGVGGFLEGAGPWVGEAANVTEGGAVMQSLGGSCVSACGEMLSGGAMSEAEFLAQLGEWSNPGALADALNAMEGSAAWQGGYFAGEADAVAAVTQGSPIAAVLQAPGLPAHMVVIEAGEGGALAVLDPAIGGTYEVTLEWIAKWVSGGVW